MKSEKIVWGLTLVFVGTILLLDNFGVIDFYWRSLWHFWPLILILVGLNMVFAYSKNTAAGKATIILVTCLILAFIGYMGISRSPESGSAWSWTFEDDENPSDSLGFSRFSEAYEPPIQRAELYIEGGATRYSLKGASDELFEADVERNFGQYRLEKISRDSVEVLKFKMNGENKEFEFDKLHANKVDFRLHPAPIWDINFELGASKSDLDFSAFKVSHLSIKGGAADFDLKLGMPVEQTEVEVKTGMARVKLAVPEAAACQILVKGGLTAKDFDGFTKQADGSYTTSNFNSSAQKIIIQMKGGMSDFEVSRY
ncbi:MAG: hypothetical protein RI924_344 [Bacteroidota bacterium]|jgi:hypothetical protein